MDRRASIKLLAAIPGLAGFHWDSLALAQAGEKAQKAGSTYEPTFFTEHEYATVEVLVDLIIPADERSGSATEAGVPAFMDFMVSDYPSMQIPMRGGLAWLDHFARKRVQKTFLEATDAERKTLLDELAYPDRADPVLLPGVRFFNRFRDLTASGFWSSRMGVDDLQYTGNTFVQSWEGCPPEVMQRLGVSYD